MHTHSWHHTKAGWGDTAVDGLLAGVAAGLLMAVFLLLAGWFSGQSWDWVLRQFDPGATPTPLTGAVTHLAVSGVYGIVFATISRVWGRLPAWLAGLAYGLLLWLLALTVTAARANLGGGWLLGIPPVQLAAAHTLYGLSLGWLVGRFTSH